jgi:hypothetical protein
VSFICDSCKKPTKPKEPCEKVVVETRHRVYRVRARDKHGLTREKEFHGEEIIREEKLCPRCFERLKGDQLKKLGVNIGETFKHTMALIRAEGKIRT